MKRVIKTLILTGAVAVVLAPMQARADGFITPWVGSAFGSSFQNGQTSLGVSAGGMGAGIIGGEADFIAEETTADAKTERRGRHLIPCCVTRDNYLSRA
jgi:hypothetical protein